MSTKTRQAQKERSALAAVKAIHGREFVEMLDRLVCLRISETQGDEVSHPEEIELLKRQMADYLNDIDRTGGIQVNNQK